MNSRFGKHGLPWAGVFFFLALWQVLLSAQNPGLVSDDSGEMIAASYALGLPHPPGYPLYCLLGKVFSLLPVGSVAFRFNLLSSLAGLAALFFVLKTCRLLLAKVPGLWVGEEKWDKALPWFAAACLFFNRGFFAQCLTAKGLVYLLSLLLITALVWIRVRRETEGKNRGPGRGLYPILFLFALGFAHHWQTQLLLVPFLFLWHLQERNEWSLKNSLIAASLCLTALSAYLYLPLRAVSGVLPDWGEPRTLSQFLWVVTRKLAVTGPQGEGLLRDWVHYAAWGGEYLRVMATHWWPGFWLVLLAGALRLGGSSPRLLACFGAIYGCLLAGFLTVPREETLFLLPVYLVMLHGLAAVLGCLGLCFLFRVLSEWRRPLAPLLGLFLLWTLLSFGWATFHREDKSRYTLAQDLGVNTLKDLPRNALFVSEGDHMLMPIWYAQFVEGKRRDLLFQPAPFLLHDWGWRQLAGQDAAYRTATQSGQTFQQRLGLLASGPRPFFYSLDRFYLGEELGKLPGTWLPAGLVLRHEKGRVSAMSVSNLVLAAEQRRRLRGLSEYLGGSGRDVSSEEILHFYAQPHYLCANLLHAEGRYWQAVKHMVLGIDYQPRAAAYGNLAALLGKLGHESLALKYSELARRAREASRADK